MKKAIRFLVPLLLVIFILASIVWYLFIYDRDFTRDSLLSQARFQDSYGNSRVSSWFYGMAYDFSGQDANVAIELANQYKADGNYTKAEYTLTNAINSEATVELYTALCRTYVEQDKLLDAVNMLDHIKDPAIKAELDALRPSAPETDKDAGYYSQYIQVSLSSSGTILYTTDGNFPTVKGPIYSAPITLPAGETVIYAISVDNQGLVSPVTILGYTITGVIEEVFFSDAQMETAIRALIGADETDKVYTNQLWEITEFTVPEGTLTYADLNLLPYLKKLTIHDQLLDSLSDLSALGLLETLDLTSSQFPTEDLKVLASLPSLKHLILNDCSLSTIDGLAGAPGLVTLDLSNNSVRHLDVLSPMTTLQELLLPHNTVQDEGLAALSSLLELTKLDISHNDALTTLAPLSSCVKLTWLRADANHIRDLRGVSSLPLLTYLSLDTNKLTDVSGLAGCTDLVNLNIAGNDIADISALSALTKLETFDFSANKVETLPEWPEGCPMQTINGSYNALTSIDSLKNMEFLSYIYMDYNLLTNIDALADNFRLVRVDVFGNEIEDVSKLREHDIIVNYNPV